MYARSSTPRSSLAPRPVLRLPPPAPRLPSIQARTSQAFGFVTATSWLPPSRTPLFRFCTKLDDVPRARACLFGPPYLGCRFERRRQVARSRDARNVRFGVWCVRCATRPGPHSLSGSGPRIERRRPSSSEGEWLLRPPRCACCWADDVQAGTTAVLTGSRCVLATGRRQDRKTDCPTSSRVGFRVWRWAHCVRRLEWREWLVHRSPLHARLDTKWSRHSSGFLNGGEAGIEYSVLCHSVLRCPGSCWRRRARCQWAEERTGTSSYILAESMTFAARRRKRIARTVRPSTIFAGSCPPARTRSVGALRKGSGPFRGLPPVLASISKDVTGALGLEARVPHVGEQATSSAGDLASSAGSLGVCAFTIELAFPVALGPIAFARVRGRRTRNLPSSIMERPVVRALLSCHPESMLSPQVWHPGWLRTTSSASSQSCLQVALDFRYGTSLLDARVLSSEQAPHPPRSGQAVRCTTTPRIRS
ncbi:uncharacterized protein C8Q71DRAFT_350698 [Rhodofomes roseus]|uniref:Uncharacterized protein n=1 Tax=Rhodofomes roseus TaxID=34475 RepID=A0ABQ8KSW1_9APHY|nr:uncharacterized protein C8Q71DRAFT_350698 [Rhodofomes roseus]KAH9841837.1 hypothetical protein C8Q71DRAFT_350698 [Rhodofomes roseus]